jgi:hypothetical protein
MQNPSARQFSDWPAATDYPDMMRFILNLPCADQGYWQRVIQCTSGLLAPKL